MSGCDGSDGGDLTVRDAVVAQCDVRPSHAGRGDSERRDLVNARILSDAMADERE